MPNIQKIDQTTRLIVKHPIAFVAAVFFCMFWITYFINVRRIEQGEKTWKELYLAEKKAKNELEHLLYIKAGIIEKQSKIIKQRDTLLKNQTEEHAEIILNSQ